MILKPKQKQKLYRPYIEIMADIRASNELSQQKLAEKAGLSPKYVTLVESGKRIPSLECFLSLLAEAGVNRIVAVKLVEELIDQFRWRG